MLDGNGVDEIFLGYKKYHLLYSKLGSYQEKKKKSQDLWMEDLELLEQYMNKIKY